MAVRLVGAAEAGVGAECNVDRMERLFVLQDHAGESGGMVGADPELAERGVALVPQKDLKPLRFPALDGYKPPVLDRHDQRFREQADADH